MKGKMKDKKEKAWERLLHGVRTLGIVCNQWGDSGKGKFVDWFADWAEIIARGTGGANAGHTISLGEKEHIFHLIPSGILYDPDGKINIIGTGTAIDPSVVCHELGLLDSKGLTYKHLLISRDAKLVLPQHLVMDRARESNAVGKIGTTGRGIGPVYEDYYARIGLTMNDLLNLDEFVRKLRRNLENKVRFLQTIDPEIIKGIMHHPHLGNGRFWDPKTIFNIDAIVEAYLVHTAKLEPMIHETDGFLRRLVGKKNILLEGAQGNLLSIDFGTYPFVTSSDCSIQGLTKGVGLKLTDVDLTLGIVKAPYMTRVGEGSFPTELGGMKSAEWCAAKGVNRKSELKQFGRLDVNDPDDYLQGIAIRMAGDEYGATTGRPRRTGWLDLPLLRYSLQHNGPNTIITKPDVLDQCDLISICTEYVYTGDDYRLGQQTLKKGQRLRIAVMDSHVMQHCQPVYTDFGGWKTPIQDIRSSDELPVEFRKIWKFIEFETGMQTRVISVGKDRDQTIVVEG